MASQSQLQHTDLLEQDSQDHGESDAEQNQTRLGRACQACRASKVRCRPSENDRACVRCKKAERACIPTEAPNKRQKRSDGRSISEIEAALAALTSSLRRQTRDFQPEKYLKPTASTAATPPTPAMAAPPPTPTPTMAAAPPDMGIPLPQESLATSIPPLHRHSLTGVVPAALSHAPPPSSDSGDQFAPDIRGILEDIIDQDTASILFEHFTASMLPGFPFMAFPHNTSARHVWKNTPITFLAILDAAADGFCEPETARKLRRLLVQVYSTCVLGTSSFSLPLLQALIISAVWHRTIESAQPGEQMDVYQISHAAANMAIIMGLGKSMKAQTWSGPMSTKDRQFRGPASPYQAPSLDARRIWLGCHYICSNTSMALQTPNIMRWTRYMDECLEVLDTLPVSLPSDKILCHHIRLQHIVEDFEQQFASSVVGPTAANVTYRAFKRQLASCTPTPRAWHDPLKISQHFVTLYMQEVAMYSTSETDHPARSVAGNAAMIDPFEFTERVAAAHGLLDVFLSLNMSQIRALPTLYFVRLTYAVVVLVKLHFAAARLSDATCATQRIVSLKVEHYLRRLLQKLSGWGTIWPAWRLTKSLRRIQDLFRQQSSKEITVSDLAWLDVWSLRNSSAGSDTSLAKAGPPSAELDAMEVQLATKSTTQGGIESMQKGTPEGLMENSMPTPQMLQTPSNSDQAWDPKLDFTEIMHSAMHDTLPSMDSGDAAHWSTAQMDQWLGTNINAGIFDFDGDLQSAI